MVHTRSMKQTVSKEVNMSDIVQSLEGNVTIRIHRDATMQIGDETHNMPLNNNELNIRLHLIPDENISNEELTIVDEDVDQTKKFRQNLYNSIDLQAQWLQKVLVVDGYDVKTFTKKRNKMFRRTAKLRGHAAWPAMIVEILPKRRAKVEFFDAKPNERFGTIIEHCSMIQLMFYCCYLKKT